MMTPKCKKCSDTGVHETGNNDLPCDCPAGETVLFNQARVVGPVTGAEVKRHFLNGSPEPLQVGREPIRAEDLPGRRGMRAEDLPERRPAIEPHRPAEWAISSALGETSSAGGQRGESGINRPVGYVVSDSDRVTLARIYDSAPPTHVGDLASRLVRRILLASCSAGSMECSIRQECVNKCGALMGGEPTGAPGGTPG